MFNQNTAHFNCVTRKIFSCMYLKVHEQYDKAKRYDMKD